MASLQERPSSQQGSEIIQAVHTHPDVDKSDKPGVHFTYGNKVACVWSFDAQENQYHETYTNFHVLYINAGIHEQN